MQTKEQIPQSERKKLEKVIKDVEDFAREEGVAIDVEWRPHKEDTVRIDWPIETQDKLRKKKEAYSTIHMPGEEPVVKGVRVKGMDSGMLLLKVIDYGAT